MTTSEVVKSGVCQCVAVSAGKLISSMCQAGGVITQRHNLLSDRVRKSFLCIPTSADVLFANTIFSGSHIN